MLPLRASDALGKIMKSDRALLESIDSPDRRAYKRRIESLPTTSEAAPDTTEHELAESQTG